MVGEGDLPASEEPGPRADPGSSVKQVPLVTADTLSGEPGLSAPVYESDYARGQTPLRRVAERLRLCSWRSCGRVRDGVSSRGRSQQVI